PWLRKLPNLSNDRDYSHVMERVNANRFPIAVASCCRAWFLSIRLEKYCQTVNFPLLRHFTSVIHLAVFLNHNHFSYSAFPMGQRTSPSCAVFLGCQWFNDSKWT